MDQQKYASAAMVLAKALVDQEKEMERTYDPERGHILPEIPLHKAREVMTRADFIQVLPLQCIVDDTATDQITELRYHQHFCD